MILNELFTALTLGLIGGLIPGPVITAVFTRILQSGYRESLPIIYLALFVETLVALTCLVFMKSIGLEESLFRFLSFIGAGILIWIAVALWKVKTLDTNEQLIFSPWKITAMILSNGVLWSYWITICAPRAILLNDIFLGGDYLFLVFVQVGWFISTLMLGYTFSKFRNKLSNPKIIPIAFKAFSMVFILFAADMIIQSIKFFAN